MTDDELYRLFLGGDDEALARLMEKYGDALTLYIDGYIGDVHEAEDLMIEVFAWLLAKRPRIRPGGLKAYIYKAARNMALRCKSRRRDGSFEYYISEPIRDNDGKGIAPFIWASLEMEKLGYDVASQNK